MKKVWLSLVLMSFVAFSSLAQSKQNEYQQGKIVSIEKLPAAASQGGEAPLKASVSRYNVSTQVGDTVYVYQYKVQSGEAVPWSPGETQQVKVKGKVMHVKTETGEDEQYSIVRTAKANTQSPQ